MQKNGQAEKTMDAKITKQRLGRLLSYDWLKIVALIVAIIFVWSLVFTMTATRITPAQQFTVFNHQANVSLDLGKFYNEYNKSIEKGVFSYEVIETNTMDLTTANEYVATMMETRLSTNEGDMIFVPHIGDKDYAVKPTEEGGATTYTLTYAESFFARYYAYVENFDDYLGDMETYLQTYFGEEWETGTLDDAKVESHFRARIQKNKDKRFKKDGEIAQGIADEKQRLEKYRTALMTFNDYLDEGIVRLETVSLKNEKGEVVQNTAGNAPLLQGNFALNICPDENTMSGMKERVYYNVLAEDGKTNKPCSLNMYVMLFDLVGVEEGFQFETLLYINSFIATCRTTA